jgi:cytochrome c553
MTKYYFTFLILVVSLGCSSKKDTPLSKETPINFDIESVMLSGSSEEGKQLFASCAVCHGTLGEGNAKLNAPALANMDSWYVYRQMTNFRKEIRGSSPQDTLGFQMAAMAKILKDSMSVSHIVAYLKTMPQAIVTSSIKGDVTKGKLTYQTVCGSCHGPSAKGNEKMNAPRLNGLEDWYIKRQILNFKNSIRGSHPKDILGAQMIPMMALLPDDQAIDDVIAYILTTEQPDTP